MSKSNFAHILPEAVSHHHGQTTAHNESQNSLLADILAELRELRKQAATKQSPPQTLSYDEVAVLLKTGRSTIERYVQEGLLKRGRHYFKIKGLVSFPHDLVERLMQDQLGTSYSSEPKMPLRQISHGTGKRTTNSKLVRRSPINDNY